VINLQKTERINHFFTARLADRFDVVVHFNEARAVAPLERTAEWKPWASAGNLSLGSMRGPSAIPPKRFHDAPERGAGI
jgi:hypothetical protein